MQPETLLSDTEKAKLKELVKDKKVLEIGTYQGGSANLFIEAGAKQVVTIDSYNIPGYENKQLVDMGIAVSTLRGKAILIISKSAEVLPLFNIFQFDVIFIDGSHEYEDVKSDYRNAKDLVSLNGLICFHDYSETWHGVKQLVDELNKKIEVVDTLAIIRGV